MNYFRHFPKLLYPYDNMERVITNIFKHVKVSERLTNSDIVFFHYDVKDGETPEKVSERFYDTPEYHWVILLTNKIHNVYRDWALSEEQLNRAIAKKYTNPSAVHHWENRDGLVVDRPAEATAVIGPGGIIEDVYMTHSGSGYPTQPNISITTNSPGVTDAILVAEVSEGRVIDIIVQYSGFNYQDATVVIAPPPGIVAVTNYEHEVRENDKKRQIRVLNPAYLGEVKRQFEELMLK